jgi:hypothetical protein
MQPCSSFSAGVRGKETAHSTTKKDAVDANDRLASRILQEQDDLLATLQLVGDDDELVDRLYEQLVDLLIEGMFLDLRRQHLDGRLTRSDYVAELARLADACRQAGLLPLASRQR